MEKKYIDSHLHLQDERLFSDADRIIEEASAAGVGLMACNSVCEADWPKVLKLAEGHGEVIPFLGVHPWKAHEVETGWQERLAAMIKETGAGVGETGLCKLAKGAAVRQEEVFCDQLTIAQNYKRPVSIHCIRKWGRLLDILADFSLGDSGLIIHSFGGSVEIMHRLLELGAYLSFATTLGDPTRKKLREVFIETPLDRILLETDSPDQYCPALIPGLNGDENKPAYVADLYKIAADLKSIEIIKLCDEIYDNGRKIFTNGTINR